MLLRTSILLCVLVSVTLAIRGQGRASRPRVRYRDGGDRTAPFRRVVAKRQVSTCANGYENVASSTMCLTDSSNYIANSAGVSEADKTLILQKHNAYRSAVNPTAKQLETMYWDDELAAVAEKWAKQCYVGHESGLGKSRFIPAYGMNPGQNGAFGYGNWDKAVTGWFNESFVFIYGQDVGFTKIGHYTQIVQDGSILVGCGYAKCSTGYQHFYFCNYLDAQYNYITPYASGTSCTSCPNKCNNNLCDCGGVFCFNGGTLDRNTCQCSCPSNFGGPKCLGASTCTTVCQNGGTLNSVSCTCSCPSGYTGNVCQTAVPCSGMVCQNGGTLNTAACTCTCASGYTGNLCQTDITPPSNCPSAGDEWYCKYWSASDCSYSNVLADCPYKCGTCQACNGLTCENNGWIDPSACTCGCHAIYTGDRCQTDNCPSTDPGYCGVGQFFPPSDCQQYANVPYDCPNMCGTCPLAG